MCVCRRVLLLCVCVCVCLCGVVWCGVVFAVWCGTLKTPYVDSKRFPCVDSKHPRVCRQHAHMVIASSAYQDQPTSVITWPHRFTESNHWMLPMFKFEKDREQHVPDSSNHSLCLIKLLSNSYCGETVEGTSREMVRFVFRSHEKKV